MPCRDYEWDSRPPNSEEIKALIKQNDRLARIACKVMDTLVKEGKEDFLLLKDDEVREWWAKHQIADAKAAAALKEKARVAAIKNLARAKLTKEERDALGIK
jgi:hypothetical protein